MLNAMYSFLSELYNGTRRIESSVCLDLRAALHTTATCTHPPERTEWLYHCIMNKTAAYRRDIKYNNSAPTFRDRGFVDTIGQWTEYRKNYTLDLLRYINSTRNALHHYTIEDVTATIQYLNDLKALHHGVRFGTPLRVGSYFGICFILRHPDSPEHRMLNFPEDRRSVMLDVAKDSMIRWYREGIGTYVSPIGKWTQSRVDFIDSYINALQGILNLFPYASEIL